jgi:hypothetical protein
LTLDEYLYDRLAVHAGLTALVGTRLSPMKALQAADLPCATWQRVAGGFEYDHDGVEETNMSTWQFDAWGLTFDSVRLVAAQIVAALAAGSAAPQFYCFVDHIRHDYEGDTRTYRITIEARILYREAEA